MVGQKTTTTDSLIPETVEKKLCKFRGITLNYNASQLLNFGVISYMILEDEPRVVKIHTEHKIKRKRNG